MDTLSDIIFVSLENWDSVWRRNQFLCASLAQRFPRSKILFVSPARDVSHHLPRGRFRELGGPTMWTVPGLPNITVLRPYKWAPNSASLGRRINEVVLRSTVTSTARALGIRRPLLWLNDHNAVGTAGRLKEATLLYDITDDWHLATFTPREKQLMRVQDRELCRRANLTVVCSAALYESRRPFSRRLLLLPNGVDAEHYRTADRPTAATDVPHWPGQVLGYTGTLHPDRIDIPLVLSLAQTFREGSIVLIGPNALSQADRKALEREPNIFTPGPVPYRRIPEYMSRFDACIVPHLQTPFTESLNPIKLWEYLACGKPIVSTNVAGFRDYSHLCRVASTPHEFIEACKAAIQEGNILRRQRIAEATQHSWTNRVDQLLRALDSSSMGQENTGQGPAGNS